MSTEIPAALTLEQYRALVKIEYCPDCKTPLPDGLKHYDHDGGFPVVGFPRFQWLFIECPRCDYQWALWKLLRRQGINTVEQPEPEVL
jgi:hypothetical protein